MDLFMDTTTALENATQLLLEANDRYAKIVERLDSVENIILGTAKAAALEARIKELEDDFTASSLQLRDSAALLDLINNAHTKINQLVDGTIPVELQYNTDVIFAGTGTSIDKSVPGKIKVNNTVDGYQILAPYKWSKNSNITDSRLTAQNQYDAANATEFGIWAKLNLYSNRLSLLNIFGGTADSSVNIYIDDSSVGWKVGQVFKVAFDTFDINGKSIKFYTNKTNGFSSLIAEIDAVQLISSKPYVELVCVDPANYEFEVDILR